MQRADFQRKALRTNSTTFLSGQIIQHQRGGEERRASGRLLVGCQLAPRSLLKSPYTRSSPGAFSFERTVAPLSGPRPQRWSGNAVTASALCQGRLPEAALEGGGVRFPSAAPRHRTRQPERFQGTSRCPPAGGWRSERSRGLDQADPETARPGAGPFTSVCLGVLHCTMEITLPGPHAASAHDLTEVSQQP